MPRPWMPLYVGDYRADTAHLSAAEHGAYLLLIMHYWQHGRLPRDDNRLARIAAVTVEEWGHMRETLAGLFGANWRHKRIDQELRESRDRYARRAAAGKQGGIAKSLNRNESQPSIATAQAPKAAGKEPLITKEAFDLADEYRKVGHIDRDDPTWAGLAYAAQIWLTRGYDRNLILQSASDLAARKPGKPLKYHSIVIDGLHKERIDGARTPRLPLMVVEKGHAKAAEYSPNDWRTRRDNAQAAYQKLRASVAADEGGEASGEPPIRVVQDT